MFSCHSCLTGALRAVVHDTPQASIRHLRLPHDAARSLSTKRHDGKRGLSPLKKAAGKYDGAARRKGLAYRRVEYTPKHLRKELEYLGDPLKLADHVKSLLRSDQANKALELVRMSSGGGEHGGGAKVTISWNHLLNYAMSRRDVNRAWSLFNDMKKRGQRPDAITYMFMLRGLAENAASVPTAVEKALTIYHSMSAPNSTTTPSLKHTNAMLLVCARARDIEALFQIAAGLPDAGRGAADNVTYTTILNAIRIDATRLTQKGGSENPAGPRYEEAIKKGKRVWEDVIRRWQEGSLTLDEELVCAMGRLLLVGGSEDNKTRDPGDVDDILSLLEQAMDIPRQVPRGKWRTRSASPSATEAPGGRFHHADSAMMNSLDRGDYDMSASPKAEEELSVREAPFDRGDSASVFDPVPRKDSSPRMYARPGNDALSLAVMATGNLHEYAATTRYWYLLTEMVRPDLENCHAYLRTLRLQRASRHALAFVKQMQLPAANGGLGVAPVGPTFRIAMSACTRDIKNESVLDTALQLLERMRVALPAPDVGTVQRFAEILRGRGRHGDVREAMGAMEVLHKIMHDLWGVLLYGEFSGKIPKSRVLDALKRERAKAKGAIVVNAHEPYRGTVDKITKVEIVKLAKLVEATTSRTMSYYAEHLSVTTKRRWFEKLAQFQKIASVMKIGYRKDGAADADADQASGESATATGGAGKEEEATAEQPDVEEDAKDRREAS